MTPMSSVKAKYLPCIQSLGKRKLGVWKINAKLAKTETRTYVDFSDKPCKLCSCFPQTFYRTSDKSISTSQIAFYYWFSALI